MTSLPKPLGAIARAKASWTPSVSTAEQIWKILNPAQTPLLHLRLELPRTVTFRSDADTSGHAVMQASSQSKYTMRTFKFVLWLLTIMVLPIAATTSALWGLLLYLLKNTELLEAQRHRGDADSRSSTCGVAVENGLEDKVTFSTLPRAFASDVELMATSKDGKVVVSVGLNNEIVLWSVAMKKRIAKINGADVLLRMTGMASSSSSAPSTITCVTMDETGRHFAVGTGAGLIAAWSINKEKNTTRPLPLMKLANSSAGVTEVKFAEPMKAYKVKVFGKSAPPGVSSEPSSPESKSEKKDKTTIVLLATYESGIAARWSIAGAGNNALPTVMYFSPSRPATIVRALLLPVLPDDRVLIAFCHDDGTLSLVETGEFEPTMLNECVLQAGDPYDLAWRAHACRTQMGGSMRLVVAASTEAGAVSLWDGLTGECIAVLEESYGRINQLRVSPVQSETCHFCGQLPMESLTLAFSVDHVVRFSKLYLNDQTQTRRCSCSRAHLQQQHGLRRISSRESLGRRSRSNSNTSSPKLGSPLIPRARLSTTFETNSSPFPVSGHGVHSRRASEKDTGRRSSELLTVPFPGNLSGDEYDLGGISNGVAAGDMSGSATPTNSGISSTWRDASVVPLTDVTCERGGWDVSNSTYVGIRRMPRSQGKSKVVSGQGAAVVGSTDPAEGLTVATLERWEIWSFDPAIAFMRTSLLAALASPVDSLSSPVSTPASSCTRSTPVSATPSSPFSFSSRTILSSSSSSTGSKEYVARLPFTHVSPLRISPSQALAGFGNTIGVFQFASS